jgi:hypothetical protein
MKKTLMLFLFSALTTPFANAQTILSGLILDIFFQNE